MYCPKCGTQNNENAKFCLNCGEPLENRQLESYTQAVALARAGEERGFTYLYEETYKSKYYLALKYMDSKEAAEDVVQDAYIKAFSKLDTLKDPETFSSWLGTIVANTAKNALQKKNPTLFSDLPSGEEDADLPDFDVEDESLDAQPEEAYTRQETAELVQEMISSLSEEQKMCILMYHIDGESIHDIAEALDCSENTVKSRLNYGRKNLKAKAEDLQKKGYKLFTLAPIPLLLFLLREDANAMTAEESFLAAGKQMEGAILQQVPSLAQAGAGTAAQTGAKAAAEAAHHGFFATTAGKVVIGVIIAGAVAGGVGGGLAVRHNNQAKEEAAREAEAAAEEAAARAETEALADQSRAEAQVQDAEPEEEVVEEVEAIPVTDEMYPELLEGGLTKEQFEDVLAHGPETMTNGNISMDDIGWFAVSLIRNWEPYPGDDPDPDATISVTMIYEDTGGTVPIPYDICDLDELNDLLSVLTDYQFNANDNSVYSEAGIGLEVIGNQVKRSSAETSVAYWADITDAEIIDDEMIVTFERECDNLGDPDGSYDKIQTAILKQTDTGRYRVDTIMDGTLDAASTSYEYDGDYILPGSDSTYLSRSDLTGLSSDELRLARNELYARHGRKFDDATLQEYFNSKDWYNGTIDPDDFSESMLNVYEVANRDLIVAYEAEVGGGSGGTNTSSASSDSADSNVTGSIREIYEQVLKDVQAGKYTFVSSGSQPDSYQYFVTDVNGDGITDLVVAYEHFDDEGAGWTNLTEERYGRVFTVTSKGSDYALKVIDGVTDFADAYYAGDGNTGFYVQKSFSRGTGVMSVALVTFSSDTLSEGSSVTYTPGESSYSQFCSANPEVSWYDASDLSGLNGI